MSEGLQQDRGVAASPPLSGPSDLSPASGSSQSAIANAFTPGPYEYRSDRTIAAAGLPLARCYADRNEQANGPLFAAAPELYEALDWAVNEFDGNTRYTSAKQLQNCIEKCRAALAKARGESL